MSENIRQRTTIQRATRLLRSKQQEQHLHQKCAHAAASAQQPIIGGARVGMRTLLDALVPAVTALKTSDHAAAAAAACKGAESTKAMQRC